MSRSSVFLLALFASGCAQTPTRPCEPTHTLYVVGHGWHSGIVVEREDLLQRLPALPAGNEKYLEIGWGEERFYQARDTTLAMALRAVLQPNPSVLQVVPVPGTPRGYFAASEISEVKTDRAGYSAAVSRIAATFKPGLERLGPSLYGDGVFYRAEGSFHLFNTCNTWVAAVLEKVACSSPHLSP
jgi:uncharacterized protein (TIGR02117 family)